MMIYLVRIAFLLNQLWARVVRPVAIGVRIALVQDGKVLLVRHTYMKGWHFPGGSVNRRETPLQAAMREAREEVGAELLETPALVGIITQYGEGRNDHVATYVCRSFRLGTATDRWEIAERKFFALNALPSSLGREWKQVLRDHAKAQQ